MKQSLRLLLADDSIHDAELVTHELRRSGFDVNFERVQTPEAMREALARGGWEAVISDWSMPQFSGLEALKIFRESTLDCPFILVSGTVGEESAVESMRAGAHDYVLKDRLTRLGPALQRELAESKVRAQQRQAEQARREAEQQLRQSQKMDAVGRLAGAVAHDFNNLLLIILGYSEMLLRDGGLEPRSREDMLEIRDAGKRASALTRQLLHLSRQQISDPRILDLNGVVTGVEKMLRRLIGENVDMVWKPAATLDRVRADAGYLEQVLMNLVVNARDALPRGGQITVATRNAMLTEEFVRGHPGAKPGPSVVLSVSDTGVGMGAEVKAKIFEPFFTTKEPGRGTGLGLSTVASIVREAGGVICVTSEEGEGAIFEVFLPRAEAAAEAEEEVAMAPEPSGSPGSETVLVVEDDSAVRALACGILRRAGYRPVEARDPIGAIELLNATLDPIRVILSDVVMPQMSGPELAKKLAEEGRGVKVLLMSGYADETVMQHGMVHGKVPFLQKPFTPEALLASIRELLDGGGPRS